MAAATMYCESDSASLCWDCDAKVHSANFLVEKHSRSLLCHVCQRPTAWSASGAQLGRTISVCEGCVGSKVSQEREEGDSNRVDDDDDESEDKDEFDTDSDDYCMEDNEDEDNQVVPWTWPPPPPSSFSSRNRLSIQKGSILPKQLSDGSPDYLSDDDIGCSSRHRNIYSFTRRESGVDCVSSLSCLKRMHTQLDP